MKKFTYLKVWFLSKITRGTTRNFYKDKRNRLKKQLYPQSVLYQTLTQMENYLAFQKYHTLFKQRDNIELPADACGQGNHFELIQISLGQIRWRYNGHIYPLTQTPMYAYLEGNKEAYKTYIQELKNNNVINQNSLRWTTERFDKLINRLEKEGYLPEKAVIVINSDDSICDGAHRAAYLFHKYGKDHKITAIRISELQKNIF